MRNPNPTAKATGLAYLMFERPSLGDAARYLTDFGLRFVLRRKNLLFFRGTDTAPFCYVVRRGPAPRFVGLGLQVESDAELKALARVPGASAIQPCSWPGGGWWVHLRDPSGFKVDVIQRQHAVGELEHRAMLSVNAPSASHRVNEEQRPPLSAPEVNKLGYVMLDAVDFQSTCAWYTQHFGFIPSDVQVLPDGSPALAFMRLDLGDTPTDHHTLALAQGIAPAYNHSAYEVVEERPLSAEAVAAGVTFDAVVRMGRDRQAPGGADVQVHVVLQADEAVERGLEPGNVGVVADEPATTQTLVPAHGTPRL